MRDIVSTARKAKTTIASFCLLCMPKRNRETSRTIKSIADHHEKGTDNIIETGEGTFSSPFRLPLRSKPNVEGCHFCPSSNCLCKYFSAVLKDCYEKIPVKRIDMRYRQPHLCSKSVLPQFVSRLIRLACICRDDIFFDLGCGNGSVLFQVAATTGVRCIGVELDPHNFNVATHALENLRPLLEKKWCRTMRIDLINEDLCTWITKSKDVFQKKSVIWIANLLMPKTVNHFLSEQLRSVPPDSRIFCFEDLYPHSRSVSRIRDPDAFDKFTMNDYVWQPSSVEWCDVEGYFFSYRRR